MTGIPYNLRPDCDDVYIEQFCYIVLCSINFLLEVLVVESVKRLTERLQIQVQDCKVYVG